MPLSDTLALADADRLPKSGVARAVGQVEIILVEPLIRRAIEATRTPGMPAAGIIVDELIERVIDPALLIALLPSSFAMMAPQVALAYNEGSPDLARQVGAMFCRWLKAEGHSRFLALNLRYRDRVFLRLFRHAGQGRRVGSLVEFRL